MKEYGILDYPDRLDLSCHGPKRTTTLNRLSASLLALLSAATLPTQGHACAAFSLVRDGYAILAANTDSCQEVEGLVIVNKRNLSKRGSTSGTSGEFASWVSKHGSITLTYLYREIAQYGMNEAGLAVSTVGLPGSRSPDADERPPLEGNIWLQYVLDTCATIDDVMAADSKVRIVNDKDQYLICDQTGRSLVVECIDGKMVYYAGASLPLPVLTNETYATCLENWERRYIPEHDPYVSNRRFSDGSRALRDAKTMRADQAVDFSFEVLDRLSQHPCTQWNVVLDINNRTVYFRTKSANNIRFLRLADIDFSSRGTRQELDVTENYSGDVREHFTLYSREMHLNRMRMTFKSLGMQRSDEQLNQLIDFLDSFECAK
jgi:choloylglycine hydrolase